MLSNLEKMKDLISHYFQHKMKSFIKYIFITLLAVNMFSCVNNKNEPVKIRVVSLQGKAKPVNIKTPDLNIKALNDQGRARSNYVEMVPEKNNKVNNYGDRKNSFYENKYNRPSTQSGVLKEQEVVYRNDFDKQSTQKADKVKYILDSNNHQGKNPIIIQNNSNLNSIESAPDNNKTVEIDLSSGGSIDKQQLTKRTQSKVKKAKSKNVLKEGYFVQVGAFRNKKNANRSLAYMKKFNKGFVKFSNSQSKIKYKVVLGPFPKRSAAQSVYKEIKQSGHDALIIKTTY